MRTAYTTCPLCEATCGLELTLDGDRIAAVRGDRADVFSAGFICPKGAAFGHLDADPDRLRGPRVRRDGELRPATWAEAFAAVEAGLAPILAAHGRDSVALYQGNPNVHTLAGVMFGGQLRKALGSHNVFTASTLDQMPKQVACGYLYGGPFAIPVPDVDRTDFLLVLGADPYSSNGSLWTAPDLPGRLKALRERGGRLVVVDPRRTRTARHADRYVPVRPGTDVFLLLGMVNELYARGLVAPGRLADHVAGVDDVGALVEPFRPEVVAPWCGVDEATIRELVADLAGAGRAAVYGRIGTTTVPHGTVTSWLIDVLNILTGNLDRSGGVMFPLPAVGHRGKGSGPGFATGRWHSRVRGLPEVAGELPAVTLADEITEPGPGQVRALITTAGNPVLSVPNSDRLDRALAGLEFMVSVDPYVNETTRHADVILPPPPPSQQAHYDLAFYTLSVRNVAKYSPPPVPLAAELLDECDIVLRLISILAGQGSTVEPDGVAMAEGLLDDRLRRGPYGLSLDDLRAAPHGVDLGPLTERIPEILRTPSGRIELCPEPVAAEVRRLAAGPPGVHAGSDRLVVIGRRHLRTNNSWMHNVPSLMRGRELCTMLINPVDAERRGLVAGGRAVVTSRVGEIEVTVELTADIAPGAVSIPHGFGHDLPGVELSVARRHAGVNGNRITDDELVDPLSGTAVLNSVPVTVRPAPAPDGNGAAAGSSPQGSAALVAGR
jgi:anaerobic selenocysteine-containing dehydrogenase